MIVNRHQEEQLHRTDQLQSLTSKFKLTATNINKS